MHLHLVRVAARPKHSRAGPRSSSSRLAARRASRPQSASGGARGPPRLTWEPQHAAAPRADVAEPADAPASESRRPLAMRVRLPPSAPQVGRRAVAEQARRRRGRAFPRLDPPCLRSSAGRAPGFDPGAQRFDSSRGLSYFPTPWPSGEAHACKTRATAVRVRPVSLPAAIVKEAHDGRDQDVRPRRRAQPRPAQALHGGRRRRVRRPLRGPPPRLLAADRRWHRLRGLRLALRSGFDIACGNKAAQTDLSRADLDALGGVESIMREITRRISFGMGVPAQERRTIPCWTRSARADFAPQRKLSQIAACSSAPSAPATTTSTCSRTRRTASGSACTSAPGASATRRPRGSCAGAGAAVRRAGSEGEMDSPPVLFEADSELGQSYIAAMELAGEYAYAGRDIVVEQGARDPGRRRPCTRCTTTTTSASPRSATVQTRDGCCRMDEVKAGDVVYAVDPSDGLSETPSSTSGAAGAKPIIAINTDSRRLRCSPTMRSWQLGRGRPASRSRVAFEASRPARLEASGRHPPRRRHRLRPSPHSPGARIGADTARLVGAFLGDGWLRAQPLFLAATRLGSRLGRLTRPILSVT